MSGNEVEPATHHVVATGTGFKLVPIKSKHAAPVKVLLEPDDVLREQMGGFASFLRDYAVVGLAIGFVLGQQANSVVSQLVGSFINPWLQFVFGPNLASRTVTIHRGGTPIPFAWGAFVYGLIEFIFVAITIYAVVKLLRLDKLNKRRKRQLRR